MVTDARAKPWLMVVLIVSLGLNVFMGGIFIGRMVSGGPPHGPWRMAPGGPDAAEGPARDLMKRMVGSLPPETRPGFEAATAKHRSEIADAGGRVREARAKIREVMLKEPFDRATLETAFADLRRRNDALQASLHAAIIDGAAELPPQARHRLADWRTQRRER